MGRFPTQDRFADKYIALTPYQYGTNNPISNIDINGDSIWVSIQNTINNPNGQSTIQTTNYYYGQDANNNWGFMDPNGNMYAGNNQFVNDVSNGLNALMTGGNIGNNLVTDLAARADNLMIVQSVGENSEMQGQNNSRFDSYVRWNPNNAGTFQGTNYISLGHELAHTQDRFNGTLNLTTWFSVTDQNGNKKSIPKAEIYSTHIENQIRSENNLPLRTHYAMDPRGNGVPPRIIFNNSRQSRFYNSGGIANPAYKPINRKKQNPFTY